MDMQQPLDRPLERFLELFVAVDDARRWFEDVSALRYAAVALVTSEGAPTAIVARLRDVALTLKDRAGWFGAMQSSIRFVVAALLVRNGDDPERFCDELEQAQGIFKDVGLKPRSVHSALAVIVLRGPDRAPVDRRAVERMKAIHEAMKQEHWWITGVDDYPTAALLALSTASVSEIAHRLERFYQGLADLGFKPGSALQTVSHLLFFNPTADEVCMRRFRALFEAFKAESLHMHSGDYDEIAYLTYLPQSVAQIVDTTLAHRVRIAALRPRAGKDQSFSLACNTALLELAGRDEQLQRITDVQALLQVQSILQAQQAAAAAAC